MLYENFVWTKEINEEFGLVILDNYHCIDDIDQATYEFVKSKIYNNGKRTTISNSVWEVRDSIGGTIGYNSSDVIS